MSEASNYIPKFRYSILRNDKDKPYPVSADDHKEEGHTLTLFCNGEASGWYDLRDITGYSRKPNPAIALRRRL